MTWTFEYDVGSSSSSSSLGCSSGSLHTESMEFYDRSSFRIVGVDDEIDHICGAFGLLGPEDFAIPAAAWEAMKERLSPSIAPRLKMNELNSQAKEELKEDSQVADELGDKFKERVTIRGVSESTQNVPAETSVGGGIKRVRSPMLKLQPGARLPVLDNTFSSWDIVRGFAPQDEGQSLENYGELNNISPNGRFRPVIMNWEKGDLLGRGSFGSVYEGISEDGILFAVKEVSLLDQGNEGRQIVYYLEQEIALLSQFEHENIVQYYGTEMNESKLYIFLQLVTKGSLASLYQQYNLRDSQVSNYTRQILHGLKYLHDQCVIHRDIKCANILVDANGSVKLSDFGLAKATKLNDIKSCKWTAFWMAPEFVKNQGYGPPVDIWSLGCTVLEMLTRQIPYSGLDSLQALFRIGKGEHPPIPDSLSRDARDFILQCLQVNPEDRPTASQLLNHPFVQRLHASSSGSASPYIGRRS